MSNDQRPRAIAALALCALLFAACATARSDANVRMPAEELGWQPALPAVYARLAGAMSRPGAVYHPTLHGLDTQGEIVFTTTTDAWIDVANGRARGDVAASFSPENTKRTSWAIRDRAYFQTLEYDPTFKRKATTCRGNESPLVAIVLACRGDDEAAVTVALADGDFHGTPAVAIVTLGTVSTPQQRSIFNDTLFLDPETYLPIALEGSGRVEALDATGAVTGAQPTGRLVRFLHAWVPAGDLEASFFDPATLGYRDTDPVGAITQTSPDFTSYWLGPEALLGDLPPLTLRDAFVVSGPTRPALRYRATVTYRPLADEFGPALIEMQQWRRDEWEQYEGFLMSAWQEDPCVRKQEMTEKTRTATVYSGFTAELRNSADEPCPSSAPNRVVAIATLGTTVVRITAEPGTPFNDADAMRRVIAALRAAN